MDNVTAIMDLRVLIAPLMLKKIGKVGYRNFTCTVTQERRFEDVLVDIIKTIFLL